MLSTKANIFAARRGPWAARPMAWPAANLNTAVLTSDQRIRVSPKGLYTYADLSMVCGKPILAEKYTLTNPRVIVEVLSSTTETNDRGLKFTQYVQDRIAGRN